MTISIDTQIGFEQLALAAPILKSLTDSGYTTPTPIQEKMIPAFLAGRDVVGQAQTGTGKTAAFALPIIQSIDLQNNQPQALILTPTRELAIQVAESFNKYAANFPEFRSLAVYGGQEYGIQLRALRRGVHVIVGTPGRVMDHIDRETLNLDEIKCLVLDEADEMLRMGFKEDVEWILERAPEDRQIALFSATMPPDIRAISRRFLNNPEEIILKQKTATVELTRQRYWPVMGMNKLDALCRILEIEPFDAILIFARTKVDTIELTEQLQERGFAVAALNGDIPQSHRERIVDQFKNGRLNIIVATDVAARGLDVDRISHVINYDVPQDTESYIHRIGRTGRAGRSGEAILFVSPREKRFLPMIEKATRQKIELMKVPSAEQINVRRLNEFKEKLQNTLKNEDLVLFRQIITELCQDNLNDPIELAAAAARMFQGDKPLLLSEKNDPAKKTLTHPWGLESKTDYEKTPKHRQRDDSGREEGMETYRIEVGRNHGVQPGHIVGAISGETGMASKFIGRIRLFNDFSTVDLPEGMSSEMLTKLKTAWICKRQLEISLDRKPGAFVLNNIDDQNASKKRTFRKSPVREPQARVARHSNTDASGLRAPRKRVPAKITHNTRARKQKR